MYEVSPEDKEKITELVSEGHYKDAIQYIRNKFNISLGEADIIVKAVGKDKPLKPAIPSVSKPGKSKSDVIIYIIPAIGILFLILSTIFFINRKSFLDRAIPVVGTVIDLISADDGWEPVIHYKFGGKQYNFESGISGRSGYKINDSIKLLIDPENPSKAAYDSFLNNWFLVLLFAVLGFVFATTGSIMLFTFRS